VTERAPLPDAASVPELLTTEELAARLKVHRKTLLKYVKRGLPCVRIGGRCRFMSAQVLRWLEERKEHHT
jgi:excisionase family DNA binding protein